MPFRAPLPSQDPAVLSRPLPSQDPAVLSRPLPASAPSSSVPARTSLHPTTAPAPAATPATLRLPAPPPPPKPLYLSTRRGYGRGRGLAPRDSSDFDSAGEEEEDEEEGGGVRERGYVPPTPVQRGRRGALPRWSAVLDGQEAARAAQGEEESAGEGTVKGRGPHAPLAHEGEGDEARTALEALFAPSASPPPVPAPLDAREPSSTSTTSSDAYRTPAGTLKAERGRASTLRFRDRVSGRTSIYFDAGSENPFVPSPPSDTLSALPDELADAPPRSPPPDAPLLPLPSTAPLGAVALHPFAGEPSFGELSFPQGCALRIEVEDVGGGWSLGWREDEGEEGRGLVPRGWYGYVDVRPPAAEATPVPAPPVAAGPSALAALFTPASLDATQHQDNLVPADAGSATSRPAEYATRSIGRHLVMSGTEFEPTWSEEGADAVTGAVAVAGQDGETRRPRAMERVEESDEVKAEGAVIPGDAEGDQAPDAKLARDDSDAGHGDSSCAALSAPTLPPVRAASPLPPSRPAPPSGSFLFRLGLVPSSTSSAFSLLLPALGRTPIPGASILAATAAPPSSQHAHARRAPLPRLTSTRRAVAPSGAEGKALLLRWVEEGDALDEEVGDGEGGDGAGGQRWDIDAGPAWRAIEDEVYGVRVREGRKVSSLGESAYVAFEVETTFPASGAAVAGAEADAEGCEAEGGNILVVQRRYSHFLALHTLLSARFCAPLITVPPLPPGAPLAFGAARFDPALVETRRRELEAWLRRCSRHPVLATCEEMRGFLAIEGEKELSQHLLLAPSAPSAPLLPLFPARVFHPPFNLDPHDAADLVDRFEAHCRAVEAGGGWKGVEEAVRKGREGERAAANDLQNLAHSLVRLASGSALPPTSLDKLLPRASILVDEATSEDLQQRRPARAWGLQNEAGALSWREEDEAALGVSKAMQAASEVIACAADETDQTSRTELLDVEALLHEGATPLSQHALLIDLHRSLLSLYIRLSRVSTSDPTASHEQIARCETLLNITSAEMVRVAAERTEDLAEVVRQWLDAQVSKHEQVLALLSTARAHFDPSALADLALTGPRLRSALEAQVGPRVYPPLPAAGVYRRAGASAVGAGGMR
ncbi:hypothetical protein DMC30DRAFT_347374 [Rhodotorula diobovata]|uniref:PX domain-containing protein n=1 Tax=Rhodotorula diobovata TaxID=5288 RepID=A0A5C5G3H4_9BASI|nr:hypothetical protein DMC30DRAFT_347374 [Rhodotorula diobovata]